MKKLLAVLVLVLAANAALLAVWRSREPTKVANAEQREPKSRLVDGRDTSGTGLSPADVKVLERAKELMTAGDLRSLVARLRAAGFPPHIVRAVITAQVTEDYGTKKKAVVAHQEVVPYWRNSQSFPYDPKAGAELTALIREQTVTLKDLLGSDAAPSDEWSRLIQERKYGNLSQDKIDRLQLLLNDYNDVRNQVMADMRGFMMPEDAGKLRLIEQEQRADLAKLFTPGELEEYEMRNSGISFQLRSQLAAFAPSEEEFRTIFRLTQADQAKGRPTVIGMGPFNPNAPRPSSEPDLQSQIAAALGPDRGADYLLTGNQEAASLTRMVTRLDLPPATTGQVLAARQEIEAQMNSILKNRSASTAERNEQLKNLGDEAYARITSLIGVRGYDLYKNGMGHWLQNLPQPATSSAAPKH